MGDASPTGPGPGTDGRAPGGVAGLPGPELLEHLVPFLRQAVAVMGPDGRLVADLSPPGGLLGRGWTFGTDPLAFLHPEDKERLHEFRLAGARSRPGWTGAVELRLQRGDGSFGLFRIEAHNRFDDPVVNGMVLTTWEVPQTVLRPPTVSGEGSIALEAFADHLPVGLVLLDDAGDPVFVNQAACQFLETDLSSLTEGTLAESLAHDDWEHVLAILARLRAAPGRDTYATRTVGDHPRLLEATFVSRPGPGTGGRVQFVVVTIEDVTHRLERERMLEHRANHDSLTGLPNRAWLLDHLHERLGRREDFVVAFVDLDGFKAVNDRRGHAAGDVVLTAVARGLAACLRAGEAVARVGGDEFVVVGSHHGGQGVAEELEQRIHQAVAEVAEARLEQVGVSIGSARAAEGDQPWDLLARADSAMYGNKRARDT